MYLFYKCIKREIRILVILVKSHIILITKNSIIFYYTNTIIQIYIIYYLYTHMLTHFSYFIII